MTSALMTAKTPTRTAYCKRLYSIEPLGRIGYVYRWIDSDGAHEEFWAGDPMSRLIELGLVSL